jgi:hypothetical protein
MSFFKGKSETITAEPMLTDEQKRAMTALLNYGMTGTTPSGYQAGQPYDLSGFNFDTSNLENLGLSQLFNLAGRGGPSGLNTARNTLSQLTDLTFDPDDTSTGFGAFKSQLARKVQDASDVLDREAARTGNRFGTAIAGEKRDLAAEQSDQIASKLADLFNTQQNRALSASLGLTSLEGAAENIAQNRISQLFNYGGLERDLQNQKANLEFSDWQRKRDEQLSSLTGLQNVFNRNVNFGVLSQDVKSPSLFSQLLRPALTAAGMAIGGPAGAAIGSGLGDLFGGLANGGEVPGTGMTQSQILGFNTAKYR